LENHFLIRDLLKFIGEIICGIILYIFYKHLEQNTKISLKKYEEDKSKYFGEKAKSNNNSLYLIGFLYSLNIILRSFCMSLNFDAGFWTLEIIFIVYLSYRILKTKIGNHQKVTIFLLAVVLFIMQIISIFIPRTKHNDCNGQECKRKYISDNNLFTIIIKKYGNYYYIPIIIIFYNIGYILKDYCWVKSKFLMDIKNVKMHHILYSIGIIGSLMAIIGFIFLTIFPCRSFKNVERIDDFFYSFQYIDDNNNLQKISLHNQICSLDNYNETTKELKLYFDNIFLLFNSISSNNILKNCLEIFVLLIYLLMNIIIGLSQMIMLKKLDAITLSDILLPLTAY
jgi:hypothetical protein